MKNLVNNASATMLLKLIQELILKAYTLSCALESDDIAIGYDIHETLGQLNERIRKTRVPK